MLYQSGTGVSGFGTGNFIAAFMPFEPVFMDFLCLGITVCAIESHDTVAILACVVGLGKTF